MIWIRSNIWTYAGKLSETQSVGVVIPTNIGWKADGSNVMGRGLAKQAAKRYPKLPAQYGAFCMQYGAATPPYLYRCRDGLWLILIPSKPLNPEAPQLSWMGQADIDLVRLGLQALQASAVSLPSNVLVPILGSGNGGLPEKEVMALMNECLLDSKFFGIIKQAP